MERFVLLLLALTFACGLNAQINAAEYFFDTDPGFGNGIALSLTGESVNQDFVLPTTGLTEGVHKLHLRVKRDDGTWSIYGTKFFVISPLNTTNMASAEYFFDSDPGFGNGIALTLSGETINQDFNVPSVGLANGVHKLYVRVVNTDGTWSLYDQNLFYVYSNESNTANISSAEYFFDTDPGLGNGTALSMSGAIVDQNFTIATTALSDGIHKLHVRVSNDDGRWSLYDRKVLYVYQNNTALITAAEYFFDIDPGFGNATAIDLNEVENLDEDLVLEVPEDLPEGDHYVYIRVLNTAGVWSLYATSDVLPSLSISEVTTQKLRIYPNPVKDYMFIETNGDTLLDYKVIDLTGQVVLDGKLPNGKIDLSYLSSGTYLMYFTTNLGRSSYKIIKD